MSADPAWVPPKRVDRPWTFCGRCGSLMTWVQRGRGFDRESGEPGNLWLWSCPRWVENGARHDRAEAVIHQRIEQR